MANQDTTTISDLDAMRAWLNGEEELERVVVDAVQLTLPLCKKEWRIRTADKIVQYKDDLFEFEDYKAKTFPTLSAVEDFRKESEHMKGLREKVSRKTQIEQWAEKGEKIWLGLSFSSQGGMDLTVDWVTIPEALTAGLPSGSWKTSEISIAQPGEINTLLQKVKGLIVGKLQNHSSFTNGQAKAFMLGLDKPAAESTSECPSPSICPLIRFSTDVSTEGDENGERITSERISLDKWRRFSSIHDLSNNPDELDKKKLRLHVSLSIEPWKSAAEIPENQYLNKFVFPASSLTKYWQIGTVQKRQGKHFDLQDAQLSDWIKRQNAILASFQQVNGYKMDANFLLMPSWIFTKTKRRIGDCEAARRYTIDFINDEKGGNTNLFDDFQMEVGSPDEFLLRGKIQKQFDDWRKGETLGEDKKLPPLLPSLTLNDFDPSNFGNTSTSVLPDNSTCNTVVRVVYHRDDVPEAVKAFPRNLQLPLSSRRMTVAEMQKDMFATCGAKNETADRLPDECNLDAKTECEWWIMPVSEQVEKMYRVDGGTVITNFIANVEDRSRNQVQMYMECHMRKVGEKGLDGL
ncbi:hypothetical protein AC578_2860 [Pseudocercospora eumusae]|uniref:Uncharacterized protein n=1 Tax=Pseudocercospora eumusae TaxID=321146 RepID=A0A139H3Q0_9PEZI|nr:hypothetical protein AC578_2860 [Pseudocercospora eumusae]